MILDVSETTDVLLAQYDQAIDHMELFIEWRHKLMVRMAAQAASAVLIARWFFERDTTTPRYGAGLVMIAGAALCFLTLLMEVRNARLIDICRKQICAVERRLVDLGGLDIFESIFRDVSSSASGVSSALRQGSVRYRWLVLVSNGALVGGLVVLSVAAFAWPT